VPPVTGAFIPFDEFLQGVRDATFEEYAAREGAQVLNSEEFEAMREHILTFYEGVEVVSTFVTDEQYFDCVTIDSQPSVRLLDLGRADLESPQSSLGTDEGVGGEAPGAGEGLESPLRLGLTDIFGNQIACDEGTIPLRRITLEEMTRFETLDAFFGKGPDGMGEEPPDPEQEVPPEEGAVEHKYAAGRQRVTNFGGNSWLNLWNPAIGTDHIFSLSQQWYAAGDGDSKQTLEGGWQVYPQKYSTNNGVLFIYYTADNYGSNAVTISIVLVSSRSITIGILVAPGRNTAALEIHSGALRCSGSCSGRTGGCLSKALAITKRSDIIRPPSMRAV
jgi:hypothetical protein